MKLKFVLSILMLLILSFQITGCIPFVPDLDDGHSHRSSSSRRKGSLSEAVGSGETHTRKDRHDNYSGSRDHDHGRSRKPIYHPERQLEIAGDTLDLLGSISPGPEEIHRDTQDGIVLSFAGAGTDSDHLTDPERSEVEDRNLSRERRGSVPDLPDNFRVGGGMVYSRSLKTSKQFENLSRYTIQFEQRSFKSDLAIKLSYTNFDFDNDWQYANNLNNPWSFDIGGDYKFFPTKDSHFLQPYIGCGLAFGALHWSYRESIVDLDTGDEFADDSLDYFRIAALIGMEIRISKVVRVGIDLQQDYTFFEVTTNEGFTDDIFENFGTTTAGARLILLF